MSNKRSELTEDERAAEELRREAGMASMFRSDIKRINYRMIDKAVGDELDRLWPGRPISGMFSLLSVKIYDVLSDFMRSAYGKRAYMDSKDDNASELDLFMSSLDKIMIEVSKIIEREEEKSLDEFALSLRRAKEAAGVAVQRERETAV